MNVSVGWAIASWAHASAGRRGVAILHNYKKGSNRKIWREYPKGSRSSLFPGIAPYSKVHKRETGPVVKHPPSEHLCPWFQSAMDVLSKPWNGLIMAMLLTKGPLRFSELRQGISALGDRMLSERLKELEARGLVLRRVEPGPPVRVAYELTQNGKGFKDVALALSQWAQQFKPPAPKRARRRGGGKAAA